MSENLSDPYGFLARRREVLGPDAARLVNGGLTAGPMLDAVLRLQGKLAVTAANPTELATAEPVVSPALAAKSIVTAMPIPGGLQPTEEMRRLTARNVELNRVVYGLPPELRP